MRYIYLAIGLLLSLTASAEETTLIIRAKAKDAKFIGSSIGGAYVIVKNHLTDEILSQGLTEGGTGNTSLLMNTAHERWKRISDNSTAKFEAKIFIDDPTFVTIEVFSPINQRQAAVRASTQLWVIPGKDILGDGIILEIPGFILDILTPGNHEFISLESLPNDQLIIKANIVMMCGCSIAKGGIWDANKMEVMAIVKAKGKRIQNIPMNSISTNIFEGIMQVKETGQYEVVVYAYDEHSGNTGIDIVNYVVED